MFKQLRFLSALFLGLTYATGASAAVITPDTQMGAAVTIQAQTGQVLAAKNENERLPIASLSKMIVLYMVEQKIAEGDLAMDQEIKVPADLATFSQDASIANIPVSTDRTYTVKQLSDAMMVASSNSAAMVLANLVAGSQENYYHQADQLLAKWGIKDPKIYSASGLANGDLRAFKNKQISDNDENKLSARETAIVAQHLVNDYPDILEITKQKQAYFPDKDGQNQTMENTNMLLGNKNYQIDGLKTGLTPHNGSNLVTHGYVDGQPVITVVLNTNKLPREAIGTETVRMLNQIVAQTKLVTPTVDESVKIDNAKGDKGMVAVTTNSDAKYFVNDEGKQNVKISKIKPKSDAKAPLKKTDTIATGQLNFSTKTDDDFVNDKSSNLKLFPKQDVAQANWITTMIQKVS
ncbi:serine hydrolase [Weissella minor]|uniref:Peptidase S11 D-alanyl-D-alanine carboxypeptidase A N-terminal domain-containing protein n=1 Tax=Weissella minor TaxID=1620 RepID=A0A0R2JQY6_9LACO|nr:serine hydrolase [Weissella minor]KRN76628.1 hypothetical protein IV67_GL000129 [Weissella minor]